MKIPIVITLHPPITVRHLLWHFCFGVCQLLDGLASVLSLGFLLLNTTIRFMESDLGDQIYDHEPYETTTVTRGNPRKDLSDEEIRAVLSETLGIEPNNIIFGGESPQSLRGPIPKKEDWN